MSIENSGDGCTCGNIGCLERLASGTAIAKNVSLALGKDISTKDAFIESKKGNKKAQAVIDKALIALGRGVVNICNIFDPDAIILGGGVTQNGDVVLKKVAQYVKEHSLPVMADHVVVKQASLGSKAGVFGAALLAMKK